MDINQNTKLDTMFGLSDKQKTIFSENVKQITSKDEQRVLENIESQLVKLQEVLDEKPSAKMEELILNATHLLEILQTEDFPISESSRKWIVFGLNYLIADFDLIPDSIPKIGYLDDALIVAWVKNIVDYDITRYKFFMKAKDVSENGSILKEMIQGDGQIEIILIPGLLSNKLYTDHFKKWVQLVKKTKLGEGNPGISVFNWKTNYTPEFQTTILMVDHELNLKPSYDSEKFEIEWEQLKMDYANLSKAFYRDLKKIKTQHPDKKIIVIALNAATFVVDSFQEKAQVAYIDDYYIFGGCSTSKTLYNDISSQVKNVYNFYNPDDSALRFIYENYEENNLPIGCLVSFDHNKFRIKNFNLKDRIKRHNEYQELFVELVDSTI